MATEQQKQSMKDRRARLTKEGLCVSCGSLPAHKPFLYCIGCAGRRSIRSKSRLVSIRRAVFELYGNKCVCCGEENEVFLTLDHINNDGYKDRNTEKGYNSREMLLRGLADKPRRNDLQILCFNCNFGRARVGVCPHQDRSVTLATGTAPNSHMDHKFPIYAPRPEGVGLIRICKWNGCEIEFSAKPQQQYCPDHIRPNKLLTMKHWRLLSQKKPSVRYWDKDCSDSASDLSGMDVAVGNNWDDMEKIS